MDSEFANLRLRMHGSRTILLVVLAAFLTLRRASARSFAYSSSRKGLPFNWR